MSWSPENCPSGLLIFYALLYTALTLFLIVGLFMGAHSSISLPMRVILVALVSPFIVAPIGILAFMCIKELIRRSGRD